MSCRTCRSSASSPSSLDVSCLAPSSIIRNGFSCMASSNCFSDSFSCTGRMARRASYNSTGSNSVACAFSSAYSVKALSNSAEYFCSCVSSLSAMAGTVRATNAASFLISAFNSHSSALSALICRLISQRSEMIPLHSNACAATPSWMVGISSKPRATLLRWSMRSSRPARSRWRLDTSAHAARHVKSCSSLFQRSEIEFCLP